VVLEYGKVWFLASGAPVMAPLLETRRKGLSYTSKFKLKGVAQASRLQDTIVPRLREVDNLVDA
jgi:hypothetical protein